MDQSEKQHFDRIAQRYRRAAETWASMYEQFETHLNPLIVDKQILDIGNGGHFAYDKTLPSQIAVLDVSPGMLDRIDDPRVEKLVGDARDLTGIKDGSMDVILLILCLHHINESSAGGSCHTLRQVLKSARKKLRPDGQLIVAEATASPWVFSVERFLFCITRRMLRWFGVSMVFFYSLRYLNDQIASVFNIERSEIKNIPIPIEGWIDPLGATFPGLISIPGRKHPLKHYVLVAPMKAESMEHVEER